MKARINTLVIVATALAAGACGITPRTAPDAAATSAGVAEEPAYVRIPARILTPETLAVTGFNRDHKRDDTYAFGYVDRGMLPLLAGLAGDDLVELDARAWARHDFDAKSLSIRHEPLAREDSAEDYHDYAELTAELERLQRAHPELATLESVGKSVQGRDLWMLKISDNAAAEEGEPKLLYIANMHGDEVVGRELMIYLARKLLDGHGRDERLTRLVNAAQIYIIPSMNPDGFELGRRYNAAGVDLNRDFPDFTSDPTDTPAGRAPETKAIMALHARHHFIMALNFHGGEVCFNMPWDTKANGTPAARFGDDALMTSVARVYADANPTMKANHGGSFNRGVTYGYEWYEVNGGMQDWSIHYRQSFHATIELSYTKWPSAAQLPVAWRENEEALVAYLEAGTHGMHVRLVADDGSPVTGATVRVSSLNRDLVYAGDQIHRPALAGEQTVQISAPGFAPQTLTLAPWAFTDGTDGDYQEVTLHR